MTFHRFPHTPHIAWLGAGQPRDDKVLSPTEAAEFLSADVILEEKVDGANIGFSLSDDGNLRIQNRGAYLSSDHSHPQFQPLFRWLRGKEDAIAEALFPDLMLFGEWCYAVHSVHYEKLPDLFLAFDVFDRRTGQFWSVARRNALTRSLGLEVVPFLGMGRYTIAELKALLGQSRLTPGPAEGIYIRRESGDHLAARAKLVRAEFVQAIDEHWSRRGLQPNAILRG